jgi:hypothetical protein
MTARALVLKGFSPSAIAQVMEKLGGKLPKQKKPNKYNAQPCVIDGIKFASKLEAGRYCVLLDRQKRGEISHLEVHPCFDFILNGTPLLMENGRVAHYTADFGFRENGKMVIEEDKGYAARDWPIRRALFKHCYPWIELREVRK